MLLHDVYSLIIISIIFYILALLYFVAYLFSVISPLLPPPCYLLWSSQSFIVFILVDHFDISSTFLLWILSVEDTNRYTFMFLNE